HNLADLHRRFSLEGHDVERERSLESALDRSSMMLRKLLLASGPSPSQVAERRELGVVLADVLAELDPEDSEVVILRNLQELGWTEVWERARGAPAAARMGGTGAPQRRGALLKERMT